MHNDSVDSINSLDEIFRAFLSDQKARLSEKTYRQYENSLSTLQIALNNYGWELADVSYEHLQEAGKTLCEEAGPDTLLGYFSSFYGYFLPRKVFATPSEIKHCGTAFRRLLKWMGDRDLLSAEEVKTWRSRVLDMTRKGRQAAQALERCHYWPDTTPSGQPDENWEDHATITGIEPGRLKLQESLGSRQFGWVSAPREFTDLCAEGMDLAVEMERFGERWYLIDVFNVYPA